MLQLYPVEVGMTRDVCQLDTGQGGSWVSLYASVYLYVQQQCPYTQYCALGRACFCVMQCGLRWVDGRVDGLC